MKPKRILVVDDEHCITDTLVAILRLSGYDAVGSYCAECAIKDCENFNPELVITDVSMPGMNVLIWRCCSRGNTQVAGSC